MLGSKALVTGSVVAADPPNLGAEGLQIGVAVAEGAGFHRATRGVVLGIKEQNQGLARQLVAAAFDPTGIPQGHKGGAITGGEGGGHGDCKVRSSQPRQASQPAPGAWHDLRTWEQI